jgi:phosphatidylinositol glycan class B
MASLPIMSHAQNAAPETPTVTVNVFNERHPISPYIYGGNFPNTETDFIQKTGTRLSRWGGNIATSHNWKLHLHNTGSDWYFENFGDEYTPDWVRTVQKHGSAAIVGIAMVDWTPKAAGLRSFSVKKYGPQQKTDPERPDAGNGMTPDGNKVKNDPNDAYVPLRDKPSPGDPPGTIYRSEWIEELKKAYGDFPHFYEFDNEPEIWDGTHRDIHPEGVSYDELRDKFLQMGHLIKSIDPKAQVAGPTFSGWWFYWNSSAGWGDKGKHGDMDLLPWWIGAIADADRKSGQRTLDIFDIHAYGEYNGEGTPDVIAANRLRSPRAYWDPTYSSEGGIGKMNNATKTQPEMHVPAIIPRFRSMVNAIYPGTGFAITEWGYFTDNDVACSLAEADIYGVFGREKVDLSTKFCAPPPNSYCSLALEMYKNFESVSVQSSSNLNIDMFTSYAALSKDGKKLTVMAINKDPRNGVTAKLDLEGFTPESVNEFTRAGDEKVITASPQAKPTASYTFKPYSQTLLVFQGNAASGAADWSIDRDSLMMVTGGKAVLNINADGERGGVEIASVKAPAEVTMTVRNSSVAPDKPGLIDVAAGDKPGFYRFTVTGKAASGRIQTQSGWIVVGLPGSLPATQPPTQ